jgi:K+-sensing histidine kinase KdpD
VGARASVSLPLRSHDRLLGVVTFSRHRSHSFSAADLAFLDTVADLFAVAIDKANLYEEIRHALRVREEFMAAAAHELRTPVTTIRTWAQVLLRRDPGPQTQQHALAAIERQTDRIARLIDGLLLGVKLRAAATAEMRRAPVDLAELVERIVGSSGVAPFAGRLRLDLERPLPVELDADLVTRALGDALEDAVRQAPEGEDVEVRALRVDGEARVAIRFAGVSIDPERRAHYFEPLFEPVPAGEPGYVGRVSIGPYLNKLVVEAHGGRVWLETAATGGTTLWASMPLATAAAG